MTIKRIKVKTELLTTRDEAESAMTELAAALNDKRKLLAQRDAQVLAINTKYETGLAHYESVADLKTDALRAWAESNPDQFPKARKSIEMLSGTLGFRTGTPKLALLSRAFTWDKVLSLVAQIMPHYVRKKMEVDKEAMLGDYATSAARDVTAEKFRSAGVRVVQDETFFIEPKLTETETRQTQEAA